MKILDQKGLVAAARFMKSPEQIFSAFVYAAGILFVLQWLFHLDQIVVAVQLLGWLELPRYLLEGFVNFLRFALDDFVPTALVIISLFQGITIRMIVYISRHRAAIKNRSIQGLVIALIASGCAACGGSILAPALSLLPTAVAGQTNNLIGRALLALGVGLAVVSFWQTSQLLSVVQQRDTKGRA